MVEHKRIKVHMQLEESTQKWTNIKITYISKEKIHLHTQKNKAIKLHINKHDMHKFIFICIKEHEYWQTYTNIHICAD